MFLGNPNQKRGAGFGLLLILCLAFWWDALFGSGRLFWATVLSIGVVVAILISDRKRQLAIIGLETIGGLGLLGLLRGLLTGKVPTEGIVVLVLALIALLILRATSEKSDLAAVDDDRTIGEDEQIELNLRATKPRNSHSGDK